MKPTFATLAGLALLLGMATASAQTDKPAPKAPYLAPVPDYGHWIVTFKYAGSPDSVPADDDAATAASAPKAPDGFPITLDTIKTGDLRGVVFTSADGSSRQFTCQGDWILSSTPKGPQLLVASSSQRPYAYYTSGFVMLDGVTINPSTYKGLDMSKGTAAFHYQSGEVEAWIDVNSMLPIAVKANGVEASYQFLPAPPRPFTIPDDQANLLQKEQAADQKARALR